MLQVGDFESVTRSTAAFVQTGCVIVLLKAKVGPPFCFLKKIIEYDLALDMDQVIHIHVIMNNYYYLYQEISVTIFLETQNQEKTKQKRKQRIIINRQNKQNI